MQWNYRSQLHDERALATGLVEVDGVRAATAEMVVAIVPAPAAFVDPLIEEWKHRQVARIEHDTLDASTDPAAG